MKASIDRQFDKWQKQLVNKSVTLEELLEIIGTEILENVDSDSEEIAQYRCQRLTDLENLAMDLEEESIDGEDDVDEFPEAQGVQDELGDTEDDEDD